MLLLHELQASTGLPILGIDPQSSEELHPRVGPDSSSMRQCQGELPHGQAHRQWALQECRAHICHPALPLRHLIRGLREQVVITLQELDPVAVSLQDFLQLAATLVLALLP